MSTQQFRLSTIRVLDSARSIPPAGAATIFAIAYIAGLLGSVAALFVAAALFVGLFAAARAAEIQCETAAVNTTIVAKTAAADEETASFNEFIEARRVAAGPHDPAKLDIAPEQLATASLISAAGMKIKKLEFAPPAAPRAPRKIEVSPAT